MNRRYLINDLAEATTFPNTIEGAAGTVSEIWAAIGERDFGSALRLLRRMAPDLDRAVALANSK